MALAPLWNCRCVAACGLAVALLGVLLSEDARAQPPRPDGTQDGLYIPVRSPITDGVFAKIKAKIDGVLKGKKESRKISTIIFDFNPGNQAGASSSDYFGSCWKLAVYIRELQRKESVKTVAFVHAPLTKHSVLPALACGELIMSETASIGDIQEKVDKHEEAIYKDLTSHHPRALVFKMINPSREIQRVKTADGAMHYIDLGDPDQKAEWSKKIFQLVAEKPAFLSNGQPIYTGKEAMEVRLCAGIYGTGADVVRTYRLPRRVLTEVWLGDQPLSVGIVEVRGPLDKGRVQSVERRIDRARGRNVNFLILVLDSEGGDDTTSANELGQKLANLKDDLGEKPLRTLAYVPAKRNLGAATFLALGCNEIVMAGDAVLGDFSYLGEGDHGGRSAQLAALAQQQGYPPAVFQAMFDKKLALYRAESKQNKGVIEVISAKDYEEDKKAGHMKWLPGAALIIRKDGELLKLDAALAKELRIVEYNDVKDLDALRTLYDIESGSEKIFRDDWMDDVAEFFRRPLVKFILIMLGIVGMILELKMPGTLLPGITAALCFLLFFWAHSFIGEYTVLAVLLFVLGLILLGLEVFVFPGFGLPGIAGILLVVGSLVIVTLEKMPSTSQDWGNLVMTLSTFALSLVAAIAAAFMLAWYLPHIPYASRLVLPPPTEPASAEMMDNPFASLLGAIGVAETPLRPSGKVRFGEDFHDVVAEGDFVNPGSRVQVIEIEGQRIVVKQV